MQVEIKNLREGGYLFAVSKDDETKCNLGQYSHIVNTFSGRTIYAIPLIKEVLEPMGFEPIYNEYTYEIYFKRKIGKYEFRVLCIDGTIEVIDTEFLHKVIHVKCETLNELQNYMDALDVKYMDELFTAEAYQKLQEFAEGYLAFRDAKAAYYEKMAQSMKKYEEEDNEKQI